MMKVVMRNGFWKTKVKGALLNVLGQQMGFALGMVGTEGRLEVSVVKPTDANGWTSCQFINPPGEKWVLIVGKMKQVGVHVALRQGCNLPEQHEGVFVRWVRFVEGK